MGTECWTVQSRDRDGRLLAETKLLWEAGAGVTETETKLLVPASVWNAVQEDLRTLLSSG